MVDRCRDPRATAPVPSWSLRPDGGRGPPRLTGAVVVGRLSSCRPRTPCGVPRGWRRDHDTADATGGGGGVAARERRRGRGSVPPLPHGSDHSTTTAVQANRSAWDALSARCRSRGPTAADRRPLWAVRRAGRRCRRPATPFRAASFDPDGVVGGVVEQRHRDARHHDLAGGGEAAVAVGDVDRVADHRVLHADRRTDVGGHDVAEWRPIPKLR